MKQNLQLFIGADHAGYALKETLRVFLEKQGYLIQDDSPDFSAGDDYPSYAKAVARRVQKNKNALGILICGTGHGMEITANRFRGIRAIVARNAQDAMLGREHNHANILVLGGWVTSRAKAKKIVQSWLQARPSKAKRHIRRVKQIDAK